MSEYTLYAKRIGLVGFVQIVVALKALIILPILTKNLGTADYGIWAQVLITISLLQPFVQLGLGAPIVRFLSSKVEKEIVQGVVTALSVVFVTGVFASLVLYMCADFVASTFLDEDSAVSVVQIAAPVVALDALISIALGSFRVFGQIKLYSGVMLLQTILEIVVIASFVLSGHGLVGAILSVLIVKAVTLVVVLCLMFSHAGFASPDYSILRPYLKYGLPIVPTFIFRFIVNASDRYVIGFYDGASSVGIYSAAYGIGNVILMLSEGTIYILRPTVYAAYNQGKINEARNYLAYSWRYLLMLSIPAAFGLSVLAQSLLSNLTTSEFVSSGKLVVPLVALACIFYGVEAIFATVVLLSKRTGIVAIVLGSAGATNLILNIILVPHFGIVAAAATTVVTFLILSIAFYFKSRQLLRFPLGIDFIGKSIVSSIVMALVIWAIDPGGIVGILVSIIVGAIVYFVTLYLIRGFNEKETQVLHRLLKRSAGMLRSVNTII